MQTLEEFIAYWKANGDKPETHQHIYDVFQKAVDDDSELKAHRHHIKAHGLGFGTDGFHWMWKLIVDSMPEHFSMLEIGVWAGQIPSLVELLASRTGKHAEVFGVSTFDGRGINENGSDYRAVTLKLFEDFDLKKPYLITGDSTKKDTIDCVNQFAPFDVVFVDGGHSEFEVTSDVTSYAPLVKVGGLLITDDSSCKFNLPQCHDGQNHFHGIDPVSNAIDRLLPPFGPSVMSDGSEWEHLFVVMHDRCWRRNA